MTFQIACSQNIESIRILFIFNRKQVTYCFFNVRLYTLTHKVGNAYMVHGFRYTSLSSRHPQIKSFFQINFKPKITIMNMLT